ncbi:MAG: phosphate ABC transporter, permease protein PstA [Rhodobacteraceae bacterium GWE1_64_9]|nr:MAG: phosphate ABC transporter, permease protein PstA [Rhodobacteraceae bacterium GWE1_64_9]OHC49902.1 MAG: phosphate ABC transporter, permease protein PstA [Rhodobacteraceae bacterium GWF1_65_7]HBD92444.1 phosphate ABC transporter permease PtsA [Gemmobacter sp.]HBU16101.1 phosphate ABC transporter permease PtsA [Gemmobacter sp.]
MTDASLNPAAPKSLLTADARTRNRRAAEMRFRMIGLSAVLLGLVALVFLMVSILGNGVGAFRQTFVEIPVMLDPAALDKSGNRDVEQMKKVTTVGYGKLIEKALGAELVARNIDTQGLTSKDIMGLMSKEAPADLRNQVLANPDLLGQTITFNGFATSRVDGFFKGRVTMDSALRDSNISPEQLTVAQAMADAGLIEVKFNLSFLTAPDASELRPEAAGLGVAILGSAYMMLIVLALSLPIGVASSIYLEELAPKNKWTDMIEVNIANLAAVPAIVYGILALALFINFAGLPQSAPIVGGLVLTLMTLPTIIIATRAALKAVPPSIRDAALGVGASRMQAIFHHVLPLAMPGILTGTILGLARALGESAPLLLIGMVAFVKDYPAAPPEGLMQPATALPVQVYQWTQRSDPAFVERASGAIIVLLVFLLIMNAVAIILRRRFERRW